MDMLDSSVEDCVLLRNNLFIFVKFSKKICEGTCL